MLKRSTMNACNLDDLDNNIDHDHDEPSDAESIGDENSTVTLQITSSEGLNLGLRYQDGTFEILKDDRVITAAHADDAMPLLEHFCRSGSYLKWFIRHNNGTESTQFAILQSAVYPLLQWFTTGVSHQPELKTLDVLAAKKFHIAGIEFTYLPSASGNGLFCLSRAGRIYWAESDPWILTMMCVNVLAMPLGGRSDVPLSFPFGVVSLDWTRLGTDFSAVHFMQIFKCVAKYNGTVLYHYIPELENILPDDLYRKSSPKERVYMALATIRSLLDVCNLEGVAVKIAGITTPLVVVYRRNNAEILLLNHKEIFLRRIMDDSLFVESLDIRDTMTINAESWEM
jgi:hypothetical protein